MEGGFAFLAYSPPITRIDANTAVNCITVVISQEFGVWNDGVKKKIQFPSTAFTAPR
jgi:hypothetical protein